MDKITLDNINAVRTILLLMPYFVLVWYYKYKVKDDFFIKPRSYVQLNFIMCFSTIFFFQLIAWCLFFKNSRFLAMEAIPKSVEAIGIIIAAGTAIIGWLFTSQVSTVNAIKANTIQILMQSRFSEEYQLNLCKTIDIHVEVTNRGLKSLPLAEFQTLKQSKKNSIQYMLNYFEFLSIGIRCGELDEELLRKSLKIIITTNVEFYKEFIAEKRRINRANLTNLICLIDRWNS